MEVEQRVIKVIREQAGTDVSTESTKKSLGFDSLDEVEIAIALEEEFKIELYDAELEKVSTVSDIVILVKETIKRKQGES